MKIKSLLCLGNVIHSTCASVHTHKTYLFYHIQDCLFKDVCPKEHFFLPDLADREVSQRYWSLCDAVFSRFPSLRLPACSRSSVSAEHLCWSHVVHLAEYLDSRCQAKVHFCFWWYVLQPQHFNEEILNIKIFRNLSNSKVPIDASVKNRASVLIANDFIH